MSKQVKQTLDFNKLEDRFFCIDVLTRARFSIRSSETELAADIDKILTSLTAISQSPPQKTEIYSKTIEVENTVEIDKKSANNNIINDDDDDDGIVDLLTGEKIK